MKITKKIDDEQIELLIKSHKDKDQIIAKIENNSFQDIFFSYYDKRLVGLIITWSSRIHPYCTYIKLVIDSNAPNSTEQLLINSIESEQPLQTLVGESETRLKNFYQKIGFKEIRNTFIATLNTNQSYTINNNFTMISLNQIKSDKNKLISLVKANYEKTHLDNPVAELTYSQWDELVFPEDILMDGSFIVLNPKEDITAYSFLHKSDEENTFELGWCGVSDHGFLNLLPELVARQCNFARNRNIDFLEGEFDTTDSNAMHVLRALPFNRPETLLTYREVLHND